MILKREETVKSINNLNTKATVLFYMVGNKKKRGSYMGVALMLFYSLW